MIPILFGHSEKDFENNGIGRLSDAVSCIVTEERNGAYELEMEYPNSGIHYQEIMQGRIIYAAPADGKSPQPFDIYKIERPMGGIVRIYAHHVSYRARKCTVMPFTASSLTNALLQLPPMTVGAEEFTYWTDKAVASSYSVKVPTSLRAVLGGEAGSILDKFGGEFEFDKFAVKLHNRRGYDSGVVIAYGKNLTDLTGTIDEDDIYNAVVPFWRDAGGDTVTGDVIRSENTEAGDLIVPLDLSAEFDEKPTKAQLNAEAERRLERSEPWELKENLKISFVALWQTEEYKDIAPLERVNLCDTVTIRHPKLNVIATAKVIRTEYDVLLDRYRSIEIGSARSTIGGTLISTLEPTIKERVQDSGGFLLNQIDKATQMLSGSKDSHIRFVFDESGGLQEILMMDTEDIATAMNVWRMSAAGIGHSDTGYAGPYKTALLMDGSFNTDFIATNSITANKLSIVDLYAIGATIGGWTISSNAIHTDSEELEDGYRSRTMIQKATNQETWIYSVQIIEPDGTKRGRFYIDAGGRVYLGPGAGFVSDIYILQSDARGVVWPTGGKIYSDTSGRMYIAAGEAGAQTAKGVFMSSAGLNPRTNDDFRLGASNYRYSDIYTKTAHVGGVEFAPGKLLTGYTKAQAQSGIANAFDGTHSAVIVCGYPASGSAYTSVVIPIALIGTTATSWQFADESSYVKFDLTKSGTSLIVSVTGKNSTGDITNVYLAR